MSRLLNSPKRRATLLLALALVALPQSAAGATPEAVRACVERNLPKYLNPGSAVVAQYADIQTSCQAALDDGSVSVQFKPAAGIQGEQDPVALSGGGSGGDPGATEGSGSQTREPPSSRSGTSTDPGASERRPGAAPRPTERVSNAYVVEAIEASDAASPFPASIDGGPTWMYALLGGGACLIIGAAAMAVRRRLN